MARIPKDQLDTTLIDTTALAANDALDVHLAGTETITGTKTFTQPIAGSITGNAATATTATSATSATTATSANTLTTPRTINGVSFNGSTNIVVADATKEPTITAGTTSQYYRGDKSFQTLDKAAVGLANVDNTSDANKPVSTATQTALNLKQNTVALTTTGSSGAATFNSSTGALNIPNYAGGGTSATKDLNYYHHAGTTPFERWYQAGRASGATATTASFTIGVIRAIPIIVNGTGAALDRLAINVQTLATSGEARIGVYANTSDSVLYPAGLLVDGGLLSTATTGVKSSTISLSTPAGLYWIVLNLGTAAPTLHALSATGMGTILGTDSTLSTAQGTFIQVTSAFGALPSTFPAGGTVTTGGPPIIGYRYSS